MKGSHICVLGLGYIGLPTAAILTKNGFRVTGVEPDQGKADIISAGQSPLDETGVEPLIADAIRTKLLTVSCSPIEADIYMICVPTPFKAQKDNCQLLPRPDLSFVENAVKKISSVAPDGALIILESTSPVGTTDHMSRLFGDAGRNPSKFGFAYCPERVLPGNIIQELEENDRIVGGLESQATHRAYEFYKSFVSGEIWPCSAPIAELCKLAENSYRDVNIAFANELSIICHRLGIDIRDVTALANKHPRVSILDAGIGVGGHCIAVDPWFIASEFPEKTQLIQTARKVNLDKTNWVVSQIQHSAETFGELVARPPKLALFGLAYKPNVADVRESPAVEIARALKKKGHVILCVEPHVEHFDGLELVSADNACEQADIGIFLVKHDYFSTLRKKLERFDIKLDFCGLLEKLQSVDYLKNRSDRKSV